MYPILTVFMPMGIAGPIQQVNSSAKVHNLTTVSNYSDEGDGELYYCNTNDTPVSRPEPLRELRLNYSREIENHRFYSPKEELPLPSPSSSSTFFEQSPSTLSSYRHQQRPDVVESQTRKTQRRLTEFRLRNGILWNQRWEDIARSLAAEDFLFLLEVLESNPQLLTVEERKSLLFDKLKREGEKPPELPPKLT